MESMWEPCIYKKRKLRIFKNTETDLLSFMFAGKKVVDVAVGSTHCLALTDDGEVHSWGSNDKLQHFDTLFSNKKQPKALPGLNSKHIVGISCGPGQVTHNCH